MKSLCRLARALPLLALIVILAQAQTPEFPQLTNADFETGEPGAEPPGWRVPAALRRSGYTAKLVTELPAQGQSCVLLTSLDVVTDANAFGNLLQSIDAAPFRGKRVRFRAAVRAEVAGRDRAALWLRVDRAAPAGGPAPMGFFDNMADRPITAKIWTHYEIVGDVAADATQIFVGCMLLKTGRVWFDDASLEILGDAVPAVVEAPRPLTSQGLANIVAFTRLLGYVRYFHPSDEAATVNWETFAITGIRRVESAGNVEELARALGNLFAPIAPSVQITTVAPSAALGSTPPAGRIMQWQHVGLSGGGLGPSIYSSKRVARTFPGPDEKADLRFAPWTASLGGGVECAVPLTVALVDGETLPRYVPARSGASAKTTALPPPTGGSANPADRATRLAVVALAWNVLQHSYPYFDAVTTDWPDELQAALRRAATDADALTFLSTLRRLVAALHDGHGNVNYRENPRSALPGFRAEWIEDQWIVVSVAENSGSAPALAVGDAIVALDGRPIAAAVADIEAEISGATPQWIRSKAARQLFAGPLGSKLGLEVAPFATPAERRTIAVARTVPESATVKRPHETLFEVEPGIFYLDLDRLKTADFLAALPKLEKARGLVFDLRGYPAGLNAFEFFAHLSRDPLTSAQWHTPHISRPDHTDMNFVRGGEWRITPKEPYLAAKRAFITDGRAISFAESCMGIVEHYKLGAIVGETTAGTNGNINTMALPGGYSIIWTGMKVLKHDGSRHHGVGIAPTIPVKPTRAGVIAGRDELLERAISAVKDE